MILDSMRSDLAWSTDRDSFQQLAEAYRYQLQVHCYRMLGSLHEAEDTVQETFLRAWRARERFEGRTSFRNWLYRIATNVCLNVIATRAVARRVWPDAYGPPTQGPLEGGPATEVAWLEPYPDAALDEVADAVPGPDARYEIRESVQLAFIAAIQQLPPRQRAVLLLRDVLGFSALETGQLLDASVASVNSALQRARATLERAGAGAGSSVTRAPDVAQRHLLERYVDTWEASNIDGFVALLREDAILRMPPWRQWYRGRDAIRSFFVSIGQPPPPGTSRVVRTAANGQPAFAHYRLAVEDMQFRPHVIQVVTFDGEAIAVLTAFVRDPMLFAKFGLPPTLPRAAE
jgi:RNA polymerase sigma-70 factor, ECF subfamily